MKFVTKRAEDLACRESENTTYLVRPKLLALSEARVDVGRILCSNDELVELNWFFPLTKEKFRILCGVNVLRPTQ